MGDILWIVDEQELTYTFYIFFFFPERETFPLINLFIKK